MDHSTMLARLEIIHWRNAQFEAVTEQLEAALPDLLAEVTQTVDDAGITETVRSSLLLRRSVEKSIAHWCDDQSRIALTRAEISLDDMLAHSTPGLQLDTDTLSTVSAGLTAGPGQGPSRDR
ncbi:hypothetical protein ACW9UR_06185 [Halovulum sp. GXIMD14794]